MSRRIDKPLRIAFASCSLKSVRAIRTGANTVPGREKHAGYQISGRSPEGSPRNLNRHDRPEARSSWAPDGTRIAFESGRFGYPEICVVDVASAEITGVTNDSGRDWNPARAPDGRETALVSSRDGDNQPAS